MEFAQILQKLMSDNNMSNYKLAKLMGCSQSSVKNWICGDAFPQKRALNQLCEIFSVEMDVLLGKKEKDPSTMTDAEVDQELHDILTELKDRPELRMLFHSTKGVSRENIEALAKMVEGFQNGGNKE